MTDDPVLARLDELAVDPQFGSLARRVAVRYRSLPAETPRQARFLQAPDTRRLVSWFSGDLVTAVRPQEWILVQYKRDIQGFEEVFQQNTSDPRQLYNTLLTVGSVRTPLQNLPGAALVPSVELLAAPQRKQLLHTVLSDFVQRAALQPAGESVLPQYMGWLLNEVPPEFWYGLEDPDLETVQLYPQLLESCGAGNEARITEQFAWLLSRPGASQVVRLVVESLGKDLPAGDIPVYLTLCEAVLVQAGSRLPPGRRRGERLEAPPLLGEKGLDDVIVDEGEFIEDSSSVTPDKPKGGEEVPEKRRRVQAEAGEITLQGEVKTNPVFVAGKPHRIKVWVGDPSGSSVSADQDFREDLLPQGLEFYPLTVVFSEPNHCPQEQVATITLFTGRRDSTACTFELIPQAGFPEFKGRFEITYKNQVLQTLLFKGRVLEAANLAQPGDGFKLVVEANLQETAGELEKVQGRDASLFVEMGGQDLHLKLQMNGTRLDRYIPGIGAHTQRLVDQLKKIADAPRLYQKLDDPATVELMRTLARQGFSLYRTLAEQIGEAHPVFASDVRTLQVLTTHEVLLPLELVYTAQAVSSKAGLCPGAKQALETGACDCQAQSQQDAQAGKLICPLRFWGLSRIIERHKIPPEVGDQDDLPRINPSSAVPALLLSEVVYALSNRVQEKDIQALHQAVKASLEKSAFAASWADWSEAVQAEHPALLLLIPHAEEQDGFLALEIGAGDFLPVDQVSGEYVSSESALHPVVLVLGCSTAPLLVPFESCAAVFRRAGAALTVTTLSPVLGRHVVPVASILLQELQSAAHQGITFGQVLLRTRQQALLQGYPVAFALVADGNIDWQLSQEV